MKKTPEAPKQESGQQNPAEIAREAFRRLAVRRIAPTPDAYREIYDEIAGAPAKLKADTMLSNFSTGLKSVSDEFGDTAIRLERAIKAQDWQECSKSLTQLIEDLLKKSKDLAAKNADLMAVAEAAISAQKKAEAVRPAISATSGIVMVDAVAPLEKATAPAALASAGAGAADDRQTALLRDMLGRTLNYAVATLLADAPELASEAEALGKSVKDARSEAELTTAATTLKQFCFKIEMKNGDMAEQHELLLRLFRLLLENVSELLEEDSWLHGQIEGVQNLLSGPINPLALKDATRSLKEVIYKQGMLKHSLSEAKVTVKNMMMTFIDRLSAAANSTGDYHQKIDVYSRKMMQSEDITTLNKILEDVMRETRAAQVEALRSRDEMIAARQEVQEAETRIIDLKSKLEQMSELVREDQLTGSLNRRGLDDVFEREVSRAERTDAPLCIAMLDLDDFKRLNDQHGHLVGDEALIHLVRVIKDTLRTMDVIGRFGGEEFMIVLPDTSLEDATQIITRLQRELTKRIFMHNNEKLLMTFSAGVALRRNKEEQIEIIRRADEALYKAKRAGKNRVIAAE
jgi:diguanylate cyclase